MTPLPSKISTPSEAQASSSAKPVRPYQRKRLIILPEFQYTLVAVNLAIILTVSALIWVGMRNALYDLKPASGLSGYEVEFYKNYLNYQVRNFQISLFITLCVGAIISIITTVILSHRLAGPIVRLRNHFLALEERGDSVAPLKFRDGDYLQDLPPVINSVISKRSGQSPLKKAN